MTVYLVGWLSEYEGSDICGVYSSRELAESSWEWRNRYDGSLLEIIEFELDADPKADEPDIDRRPYCGP